MTEQVSRRIESVVQRFARRASHAAVERKSHAQATLRQHPKAVSVYYLKIARHLHGTFCDAPRQVSPVEVDRCLVEDRCRRWFEAAGTWGIIKIEYVGMQFHCRKYAIDIL